MPHRWHALTPLHAWTLLNLLQGRQENLTTTSSLSWVSNVEEETVDDSSGKWSSDNFWLSLFSYLGTTKRKRTRSFHAMTQDNQTIPVDT
eukprot:scaffold1939_cov92-Cylindrotheca_fusiformis.AAC.4